MGVANFLPGLLAEEFIILFDDGTDSTVDQIIARCVKDIQEAGRIFATFDVHGTKSFNVTVSGGNEYLK
jgi:hypothetical protein